MFKILPTVIHAKLICCMAINAIFQHYPSYITTIIAPIHSFLGFLFLVSSLHDILPKQLAAFQNNHHRNKGKRQERGEPSRNDFHQSQERIFFGRVFSRVFEPATPIGFRLHYWLGQSLRSPARVTQW